MMPVEFPKVISIIAAIIAAKCYASTSIIAIPGTPVNQWPHSYAQQPVQQPTSNSYLHSSDYYERLRWQRRMRAEFFAKQRFQRDEDQRVTAEFDRLDQRLLDIKREQMEVKNETASLGRKKQAISKTLIGLQHRLNALFAYRNHRNGQKYHDADDVDDGEEGGLRDDEIDHLEAQLNNLESRHQKRLAALTAQTDRIQQVEEKARERNEKLQSLRQEYESKLEANESRLLQLQTEQKQALARIGVAKNSLNRSKNQHDKEKRELDEIQGKITKLEVTKKNLKQVIIQLEGDISALKSLEDSQRQREKEAKKKAQDDNADGNEDDGESQDRQD